MQLLPTSPYLLRYPLLFFYCYAGDTRVSFLYKKLVQVNLYKKLACLLQRLAARFFLSSFLHSRASFFQEI